MEADLNNTKFTMNALLVIVTVFSAIGLLFTVGIYDMGQHAFLVSSTAAANTMMSLCSKGISDTTREPRSAKGIFT